MNDAVGRVVDKLLVVARSAMDGWSGCGNVAAVVRSWSWGNARRDRTQCDRSYAFGDDCLGLLYHACC